MKILKQFILFVVILLVFSGCEENNREQTLGNWQSKKMVPFVSSPGVKYIPVETEISISEQFIRFYDQQPLKYISEQSGKIISLKIEQDSFFIAYPSYQRQIKAGSLKTSTLNKMLTINCTVIDSATMECNIPEYWTGSKKRSAASSRFKFREQTYINKKSYEPKNVTFFRQTN